MSNKQTSKNEGIRQAIEYLDTVDLTKTTEKQALRIIADAKNLLDRNHIPRNTDYRKKYNNFSTKVRVHFELLESKDPNISLKDFRQHGRKYAGDLEGYQTIVLPSYDRLFLSRVYNSNKPYNNTHTIRLSWRFNIAGRIDFIDYLFPKNRENGILIAICGYESVKSRWNSHPARYYELPREMAIVNAIFQNPLLLKQYLYLLLEARDIAIALNDRIKGKEAWEPQSINKEGDLNLTKIIEDNAARYMIKRVANLKPRIELCNTEGIFAIKYDQKN